MGVRVLVADVGGTNSRFAVLERRAGAWVEVWRAEGVKNREHGSFEDAAAVALATSGGALGAVAAGVAVAGPVVDALGGRVARLTNLPWPDVVARALEARLGMRVALVNDLEAVGHGLGLVPDAERVVVKASRISSSAETGVSRRT